MHSPAARNRCSICRLEPTAAWRSEEHTSELQSPCNLACPLLPGKSTVLDVESTEIPVDGAQEQSAFNDHFESSFYHPLFLLIRRRPSFTLFPRPALVRS